MANDKKYGKNMTEKLCQKLTDLLVGDDKCDMANIICSLGSTSACESNHGRIVGRNIHRKGMIHIWPFLTSFDLDITFDPKERQ